MTAEYEGFLAHYGVPGQKWGVRNYQNADGSYTEAGRLRYWGGNQRRQSVANMAPSAVRRRRQQQAAQQVRRQSRPEIVQRTQAPTQEELEARRARRNRVIAVVGGVTLAAALGYAAYRGSTNLRNAMRRQVEDSIRGNAKNINTLYGKYWSSADRRNYVDAINTRAKEASSGLTRRDAVSAKLYEKTGLRVDFGTRKEHLAERRSQQKLSNFITNADKRAKINKDIHDARQRLREAEYREQRYLRMPKNTGELKADTFYKTGYAKNVASARENLDQLLLRRRRM